MVETYDGKKYITNDALFHAGELAYIGWLKIDEKYRKLGISTFMHFRLEPGVQVMTWTQYKKRKGIVTSKTDTIFSSPTKPIGTLYEPIVSPAYVTGIKRLGHRVFILCNDKLKCTPSWAKQRKKIKNGSSIKQRNKSDNKQSTPSPWYNDIIVN